MIDIKKFLENKKNKKIVIFSAIGLAVVICVIILIIVLSKPSNSSKPSSTGDSSVSSDVVSDNGSSLNYDPTASMSSIADGEFESIGEIIDFEN